MTKPILVCMTWRGGARFERCLNSIAASRHHFSRVILSVTSPPDSADMAAATRFQKNHQDIEVICTGTELPTMQHQAFWVDYLETSGAHPADWIYWLAYDDEVRPTGIDAIVTDDGTWPLTDNTAYFGPWAMRHGVPVRSGANPGQTTLATPEFPDPNMALASPLCQHHGRRDQPHQR